MSTTTADSISNQRPTSSRPGREEAIRDLWQVAERETGLPVGIAGGAPGSVGHSRNIAADGTVTEFGACAQTTVEPGDRFEIETPGGGGFGREAVPPCRCLMRCDGDLGFN
jgi:hypothetical protein